MGSYRFGVFALSFSGAFGEESSREWLRGESQYDSGVFYLNFFRRFSKDYLCLRLSFDSPGTKLMAVVCLSS